MKTKLRLLTVGILLSSSTIVTKIEGAVTSTVDTLTVLVPSSITKQPTNQSVSLGANVKFRLLAAGTTPLYYQWRFNEVDLPGKTNTSLVLTNLQLTDAGGYTFVATNIAGSVTSQVARLEVDPTFTKITTGRIVTDSGYSFGCAWGDYNNDGFIDLLVCNVSGDSTSPQHYLYRNNGDGTFTRITNGILVNEGLDGAFGVAWGDYDNDGNLDIFLAGSNVYPPHPNRLYRNNGNRAFTKITTGLLVTERVFSHAGVWADFDNDGLIDLFVANLTPVGSTVPAQDNYLYRNKGDGTFDRISFGTKSFTNGDSWNAAAADFNNDGWTDLFVPQGGRRSPQNSLLYSNNHEGSFTLQTNSIVFTNKANSVACAWGDYDNDGFLDLFVSNFYGRNNFLYHNNGDGTFTQVTNDPVTLDGGTSVGCAWGDYDNDGWLDLFVANLGPTDPSTGDSIGPENNFLYHYHNNGDGTFTKITSFSLVNELGYSYGCAWADYDNDGFLDLFACNSGVTLSGTNFLYRNNGGSNNWINVKLVGTVSNRAAIGAKVRVRATICGMAFWQMREISGGSNFGSQNDMRASFGLGDATNLDLVRIEWPSGIVQTMTNVAAKQFLTVVEHQEPGAATTSFTSVSRSASGAVDSWVTGDTGLLYLLEASTNLVNWNWLGVRSNATGGIQFTDSTGTNYTHRFYRVSVP
ncbi:MAG: FG-GAP-like repeat-containing protein [Verrucomicrobiota bacterium]